MSNKEIVRSFFTFFATNRDVEACDPLLAEEIVVNISASPVTLDKQGYKQLGLAFLAAFSDMRAEIQAQYEDGDTVITELVWGGTNDGSLQGMPVTSRSFTSRSIVVDTLRNGKIVRRLEVSDLLGMMQQLGLIPAAQPV